MQYLKFWLIALLVYVGAGTVCANPFLMPENVGTGTTNLTSGTHSAATGLRGGKKEIDYLCLNRCVNDGKTSTACMSQCTYIIPSSVSPPLSSADQLNTVPKSGHREFEAPVPVKGLVLPSDRQKKMTPSSEDYTCAALCQKDGFQYDYCKQKCLE